MGNSAGSRPQHDAELLNLICQSMSGELAETLGIDLQVEAAQALNSSQGLMNLLAPWGVTPDDKVLDLGCGLGLGLGRVLDAGLNAWGVEPGEGPDFGGRIQVTRRVLERRHGGASSRVIQARGEALPFRGETFDFVASIAVLEHVNDVRAVLEEANRVLDVGGLMLMDVPNYWSYREPHYSCRWLPILAYSRRLADGWLRHIIRRDPSYLSELNFVTPWGLKSSCAGIPSLQSVVVPRLIGRLDKLAGLYLALQPEYATQRAFVLRLRRHPKVSKFVASLLLVASWSISALGFAPTMLLLGRKRPTGSIEGKHPDRAALSCREEEGDPD